MQNIQSPRMNGFLASLVNISKFIYIEYIQEMKEQNKGQRGDTTLSNCNT